MKTLKSITVTRVYSAVTPTHKTSDRHHVERRPSYAISFSMGGRIEYRHDEDKIISDENTVIIHPMGASYDFTCTKGGAFGVINFYTSHFFTDNFIRIKFEGEKLTEKFEEIRSALASSAHHAAMRIIYEILELLTDAEEVGKNPVFRSAVREISARFSSPDFTVASLAASLHISESYLRRIFTEEAGISPKKYLMSTRISGAKKLLEESGKSVGKVAEESGFSGVYHFCRAFRDATGKTPVEYRKSKKAQQTKKWQM